MKSRKFGALGVMLLALSFPSHAQSEKSLGSKSPQAKTTANQLPLVGKSPESVIMAKEREVWDAVKKKDQVALASLLADDCVANFGNGLLKKSEVLRWARHENVTAYEMDDMKVTMLTSDAAFIVYKATERNSGQGKQHPKLREIASYWVRRGGKWLKTFHQETVPK